MDSPRTATAALETRVRAVITRTFNLTEQQSQGKLRMGSPPAWDSLGHMQLVVALEQEFGVRFPSYQLPELTEVDAIVRAVQSPAA